MRRIKQLTRIDPNKVKIFYIGIDPKYYCHSDKNSKRARLLRSSCKKYVIGTIARLVEQKGIDDFIITASEVNNLDEEVSFVIIGVH